jgi:4a-hydroxytetrahydrobiopterin dehydratase
MVPLAQRTSKAYQKGDPPLPMDETNQLLRYLHDWSLDGEEHTIQRCFKFTNYYQTVAFVNAVAWIAHQEDHHPHMEVGYNRCVVRFTTHSVGGLSENDFICAAKIDAIL